MAGEEEKPEREQIKSGIRRRETRLSCFNSVKWKECQQTSLIQKPTETPETVSVLTTTNGLTRLFRPVNDPEAFNLLEVPDIVRNQR